MYRLSKAKLGRVISVAWLALAGGAVVWILARGSAELLKQPVRLRLSLVLLSFLVVNCGLFITIVVWHQILARLGARQSFRDDWRIYSYSALGVALPGGIWRIVGRVASYQQLGADSLRVVTAGVVEAFVTGIAAMALYAVSVIVRPDISLWKRPEISFIFLLLALFFLHPRVFSRASAWILKRSRGTDGPAAIDIGVRELAGWICLEVLVVLIGGIALFILLNSLTVVPGDVLIRLIAGWSAAVAVGNLFFWLPGTFMLSDGALVLALASSVPVPVAILFTLLVRVWSLGSLLLVAGFSWLLLDFPRQRMAIRDIMSRFLRKLRCAIKIRRV